jgi:hypothetical protein
MYAFLISEGVNYYSGIRVVKLKDNVKIEEIEGDITDGDYDGYYDEESIRDKIEEEIGILYINGTVDSKYPVYVDKSLIEQNE